MYTKARVDGLTRPPRHGTSGNSWFNTQTMLISQWYPCWDSKPIPSDGSLVVLPLGYWCLLTLINSLFWYHIFSNRTESKSIIRTLVGACPDDVAVVGATLVRFLRALRPQRVVLFVSSRETERQIAPWREYNTHVSTRFDLLTSLLDLVVIFSVSLFIWLLFTERQCQSVFTSWGKWWQQKLVGSYRNNRTRSLITPDVPGDRLQLSCWAF